MLRYDDSIPNRDTIIVTFLYQNVNYSNVSTLVRFALWTLGYDECRVTVPRQSPTNITSGHAATATGAAAETGAPSDAREAEAQAEGAAGMGSGGRETHPKAHPRSVDSALL